MLISYNWLQKYFEEKLPSPDELVDLLSLKAFEIEGLDKVEDDFIIDVDVLPNRAHDCLSHDGLAREISAILGISLKDENTSQKTNEVDPSFLVDLKTDSCRRYIGKVIRGIEVKDSPEWLKKQLRVLGQKPISNVVDATNYIMLKTGQPLHAFDLDKLDGEIVVRQAVDDEKMTTLDGKEVELSPDNMVIADRVEVLALAGVKGGTKAEVEQSTKNIILESANFDPVSVRKSSRTHNILTDSSKRFENEPSPELTHIAMDQLFELIVEISGNKNTVVERQVDQSNWHYEPVMITFDSGDVEKILGIQIPESDTVKILESLGFIVQQKNPFIVQVPYFRLDVTIKEDVIEDLGRLYGYDKIEIKVPEKDKEPKVNKTVAQVLNLKKKLQDMGFSEIYNYSFVEKGELEVKNPLATDKAFIRNNLKDKLAESLSANILNKDLLGLDRVKIFEIGQVFNGGEEKTSLCIGLEKRNKKDKVSEKLKLIFKDLLGMEISIPQDQTVWEEFINFDNLQGLSSYEGMEITGSNISFSQFSLFPFIARDISVWLPESTASEDLTSAIKENGTDLLISEPRLIDRYEKEGRVSYAFRMIFQAMDRTLTDGEVGDIMKNIEDKVKEKGWEVR